MTHSTTKVMLVAVASSITMVRSATGTRGLRRKSTSTGMIGNCDPEIWPPLAGITTVLLRVETTVGVEFIDVAVDVIACPLRSRTALPPRNPPY